MNAVHEEFRQLARFLTYLPSQPQPSSHQLLHEPVKCRTLFLSDLHINYQLEANHCLDICGVLDHVKATHLIIVGDSADLRKNGSHPNKNRKLYNPEHYTPDMVKVLRRAARNFSPERSLTVLGGNHDAGLRDLNYYSYGNFHVAPAIIHYTAAGTGYLVTHGDQFDTAQNVHSEERLAIYKQNICRSMDMLDQLCVKRGRKPLAGILAGHAHEPANEILVTNGGRTFIYHNLGAWPQPAKQTFIIEDYCGRLHPMQWDRNRGVTAYHRENLRACNRVKLAP